MSTPPTELSNLLLGYEKYKDSKGVEHDTRITTASLQWLITAKNSKIYVIKFDKNFAKKHLYTSSKKTEKVEEEAENLWKAAGSPKDKTKNDYMVQAQKNIDEKKFKKQLGHRSDDEQALCVTCGHEKKRHETGKGAPTPCKAIKTPPATACGCAHFVSAYQNKRTLQNKPEKNPLQGATTDKNTAILMNKIPKATFEQVVSDALIAKETTLGTTAWGTKGEHIKWDFGSGLKGCVLQVTTESSDKWTELQGVEVVMNKLPSTDTNKPIYQVVHLHGGF